MLTQLSGEPAKHLCPHGLQFSVENNHRTKMFRCPCFRGWADLGLSWKQEGNGEVPQRCPRRQNQEQRQPELPRVGRNAGSQPGVVPEAGENTRNVLLLHWFQPNAQTGSARLPRQQRFENHHVQVWVGMGNAFRLRCSIWSHKAAREPTRSAMPSRNWHSRHKVLLFLLLSTNHMFFIRSEL